MKQRPSTRGGSSLVCFYIDYWFLLLIIISIFDYRNVMASVWCPVNPRMVILLESSLCLCIARVYAARIFWILYLCVTMSLNEGREFFFFFLFFRSIPLHESGMAECTLDKAGMTRRLWGSNTEFSSHKSPLSTVTCNPTGPAPHTAVLTSERLTEARSEFHYRQQLRRKKLK